MTRTRVFQSGRGQVIRLPDEVALPEGVKEVVILHDGAPADSVWDDFFAEPGIDLPHREQPPLAGASKDSARGTRKIEKMP